MSLKRQHGNAALIGVVLLAASLLANAVLWRKLGEEHDQRIQAEANLQTANAATKACNDSIDGLEKSARAAGAKAEKDRQAAAERRKKRNAQADRELATPPTAPGNDCQSAQDRVRRILSERAKP